MIKRYQNRSIETAQVIEELIEMAKKFAAASKRGDQLGLNDDELAFYDALANNESSVRELGDETLAKIAHELTDSLRQNVTVDWSNRDSVRAAKGVRVFAPRFNQSADMFNGASAKLAGFRTYFVFNLDEVINFNPDHTDLFAGAGANPRIDEFVVRTGAEIAYGGDRACYWPHEDRIEMPPRHRFRDTLHTTADEGFYSTIVHELVHWTKHVSRANRTCFPGTEREAYAFEELVAELGAAIICTRFAQRLEPREDHAAYLKSWLSVLDNDFGHFFRALNLAQVAAHWLYWKTSMVPEGWSQDYHHGFDDGDCGEHELEHAP